MRPNESQVLTWADIPDPLEVLHGWTPSVSPAAGVEAAIARSAPARGAVVGLRLGNEPAAVAAMLALLKAGMRVLVVAPDTPAADLDRLLERAGGGCLWDPAACTFQPAVSPEAEPGILLATSGSTGAPTLVFRPLASWFAEGRRYVDGGYVRPDDHCLLPLPLSHAYGLGWLWGALLAGARIELCAPTALSSCAAAMTLRTSVAAVTPNLARLLGLRQLPAESPPPPFSRLRLVMAGAGPVDAGLDESFRNRFGIGLSRNYGSTETGALAAGPAPLPAGCVGVAMPGVAIRIVDDTGRTCEAGETGRVLVSTDGGGHWRDMQDLACMDGTGQITIKGREGAAIRRGDRWVWPAEIEAAIRASGRVSDVHVRGVAGTSAGNDRILAEIVPNAPGSVDREALLRHCRDHLPSWKVPDGLWPTARIGRNAQGKVAAKRAYRLGDPGRLVAAASAYKRGELLFALAKAGALTALAEGADSDQVAAACGLAPDAVAAALELARRMGLVEDHDGAGPSRGDGGIAAFVDLEMRLSRGWSGRDAILDTLRSGMLCRPFDRAAEIDGALVESYQRAMNGPHRAYDRKRMLRALRLPAGCRVLEVTSGPGAYAEAILAADPSASAVAVRIGRLCGPLAPALAQASPDRFALVETAGIAAMAGHFDACILNNALHMLPSGLDVADLAATLGPTGALAIDDLTLPEGDDAAIGIDWLTHGGLALATHAAVLDELARVGLAPRSLVANPEKSLRSLIIATRSTACPT